MRASFGNVWKSDLAETDLIEIWLFIAKDSPGAADRFLDLLSEKCESLARSPEMGRRRNELGRELRSFPIGRYVIFYRAVQGGIEIARVLSAYRDLSSLLP